MKCVKCDRCKRTFEDAALIRVSSVAGEPLLRIGKGLEEKKAYEADLCWDCLRSLNSWLNAPESADDAETEEGTVTAAEEDADLSQAYGVMWNYTGKSSRLVRIGKATAFVDPSPARSLTGSGSSPFDNVMPWAGMKRHNVIDGELSYSQDDDGFDQETDDTVVWIPKFYYYARKNEERKIWTWAVSPEKLPGFRLHPGSGRGIGRYHTGESNGCLYTRSGEEPLTNVSWEDCRARSAGKGADWWMMDAKTWSAVQLLYLVEYADFDAQAMLGTGSTKGSPEAGGGTDDALYHTLKASGDSNQYRWIEDPFSNVFDWLDGLKTEDRRVFIETDTGTNEEGIRMVTEMDTGITIPDWGWIRGFGYSKNAPWAFLPDEADEGSRAGVGDRADSDTGTRVARVGGYCSDGADCGFFYLSAYYNASYTNATYGSRLLFTP